MQLHLFQVDALLTNFPWNPAAICLLAEWFNDELLQAIAIENNLSETAFIFGKIKDFIFAGLHKMESEFMWTCYFSGRICAI